MSDVQGLVSIGIPTFNRSELLLRAIRSAQSQSYAQIEILVSDNASTDDTAAVCAEFARSDSRIRFISAETNQGATWNFNRVLAEAKGEYFMWLGDDDWVDPRYVECCLTRLAASQELSLVAGRPEYLRNGVVAGLGDVIRVHARAPWIRVLAYYMQVSDNGIFYGLMRTRHVRDVPLRNELAADWFLMSAIAFKGKIETLSEVMVHRELGGSTASYAKLCRSLGLPRYQAVFPELTIAVLVARDAMVRNPVLGARPLLSRFLWGVILLTAVAVRLSGITLLRRAKKELAKLTRAGR